MHDDEADSQATTRRKAELDSDERLEPGELDGPEDDRLLELLEQWDERYRRGEDAAPESFGIDDPALREALRERIELRKPLYDLMKLAQLEQDRPDAPAKDAPRLDPAPIPPPADPKSIGRYRIVQELGQGGFGRVYLAYDTDLQRDVAVKVPVPGDASRFLDVEAYLREARIVARLSHPNIVPVYDVGRTGDGRCYVVSKYMEGGDLRGRLGHGRLAFGESAELVAVLCDALQYTHTKDLFHRDVKPANILLDAVGVPSLADFGLALRDEDVGRGAGYLGTAAYMSPEQARGEGHRVDGRSDIFSIGVVLYELLTGRRPFRGGSHLEIMQQVIGAEPRPPRQIDGTIPGELERICLKAMAKRASERYTTARDLADDLRHFLETVSWTSGPTAELPPVVASAREPAPGASDSGSRPIKIVPKGLGSFDEHDADFFLELLPGPRDRDGLPEGLRFWKSRIETADPDRAFRVGLIYGPSGCGKSSMVKAGLLPRLAPQICAIYVEAAGAQTGSRLQRGLRRLFPALSADGGLAGGLKVLRRGHGLSADRKVLLVLDQFEQWLFARREARGDDLVAALRQCDGEHIQALCLVRDDFWMAATRFMKDLDIDLVPERNVAAVDLFEPRHARKVLAAYGRAYDVLPPSSAELSRDQATFLDQAVAGLAQDGRIVSVRLALFAEMVKGRPWTPATLREVGGMDGVGVKFLEDTFSSPRSNPNHRYHQRAAQAVLKALLPETNADIKGRMRSVDDLRAVSGYADRPSEFADLVRMLDSELRLITPVDPEGSVDKEVPAPAPGAHYFQLTHDYLVHALRDWLTRKQRETRRGRAELMLAERAALWNSKPEDRYLPSVREWASIRLLTKPKDWSESQRRMMKRADRVIGRRVGGVAVLVGIALAAGLEIRHEVLDAYDSAEASRLVKQLSSAATSRVRVLIPEVLTYRSRTEPMLREIVRQKPDDSRENFHARLALHRIDDGQIKYLHKRLFTAGPDEMAVIRDELARHRDSLTGGLWEELHAARPNDDRVLPLASALASYDPENSGWPEVGGKIAGALARSPIGEWSGWREAMRGVRTALIGPVAGILRDPDHRDDLRHAFAATCLSDYAADKPGFLVDLLLDADPKSFSILFDAVQKRSEVCVADLREAVVLALPPVIEVRAANDAAAGKPAVPPEEIERTKDRLASRGAQAAVALVRLRQSDDNVWRLLDYRPDPRSRSAFIHALSALGADPAAVAHELGRLSDAAPTAGPTGEKNAYLFDSVIARRRALILALAGCSRDALDPRDRDALAERLGDVYREDPDAGIHSAAELVLKRWGYEDRLKLEPRGGDLAGRRWYVNPEGQTMVLVDGPVVFDMGSPDSDPDHQEEEIYHRRRIPRRFYISSKEVTYGEFLKYLEQKHGPGRPANIKKARDPDCPQGSVTWFDAAAYCNWLSDREDRPRCYEFSGNGESPEGASRGLGPREGMRINLDAVARGGYRLPTEAEWEYTCRAGTVTSRYYGYSLDLLGYYAWHALSSGYKSHPCGALLPNEFGLFDMSGNVMEWCHDAYRDAVPAAEGIRDDLIPGEVLPGDRRYLRSDKYSSNPREVRSASRGWFDPWDKRPDLGFRLARTCP
jgi:serine/threonine protein kinase/formylglycine-generating enzyme required for sulfatase activity